MTAVAVAAIVAVVALTSLRGGAPSPTVGAASATPYQSVKDLVEGVPQSGATLGSPTAPVHVTLYGDLECPLCGRFVASRGFAQFVSHAVRPGEAQLVFRSFCTTTCNHATARVFDLQQAAAYAAGRQSLFWQYALLFYREHPSGSSEYVTASYLTHLAAQIPGLNVQRWKADRSSTDLLERVRHEQRAATKAGLIGTPTVELRGRRAVLTLSSVSSSTTLLRAVRAAKDGCPRRWRAIGFARCRDFV